MKNRLISFHRIAPYKSVYARLKYRGNFEEIISPYLYLWAILNHHYFVQYDLKKLDQIINLNQYADITFKIRK